MSDSRHSSRERFPSTSLVATAAWVNRLSVAALGDILVAAVLVWARVGGRGELLGPGLIVALATALSISFRRWTSGYFSIAPIFAPSAASRSPSTSFGRNGRRVRARTAERVGTRDRRDRPAGFARAPCARAHQDPAPLPALHRDELSASFGSLAAQSRAAFCGASSSPLLLGLWRATVATARSASFLSRTCTLRLGCADARGHRSTRCALPAIGRSPEHERIRVAWTYTEALSLGLAPLTGLLAVLGPFVLTTIAGPRWASSAAALSILVWGMAARVAFPSVPLAQAVSRPGLDAVFAVISFGSFVALDFIYGWSTPLSAAYSVATDTILAILAVLFARRIWGSSGGSARRHRRRSGVRPAVHRGRVRHSGVLSSFGNGRRAVARVPVWIRRIRRAGSLGAGEISA